MGDYSLVPVDHQPDFDGASLVPIEHDPFGADGMTQQAAAQTINVPATGMQIADAANDNRTPEQLCSQAQAMSNAAARMSAPIGEAQTMMQQCKEEYDLCSNKAARGIFSRNGDIIHFPDGGTVIFRPQYQLYVPSPDRPENFLKPD
jgi:hypothetical protein